MTVLKNPVLLRTGFLVDAAYHGYLTGYVTLQIDAGHPNALQTWNTAASSHVAHVVTTVCLPVMGHISTSYSYMIFSLIC